VAVVPVAVGDPAAPHPGSATAVPRTAVVTMTDTATALTGTAVMGTAASRPRQVLATLRERSDLVPGRRGA
jgi:hypothetical protein